MAANTHSYAPHANCSAFQVVSWERMTRLEQQIDQVRATCGRLSEALASKVETEFVKQHLLTFHVELAHKAAHYQVPTRAQFDELQKEVVKLRKSNRDLSRSMSEKGAREHRDFSMSIVFRERVESGLLSVRKELQALRSHLGSQADDAQTAVRGEDSTEGARPCDKAVMPELKEACAEEASADAGSCAECQTAETPSTVAQVPLSLPMRAGSSTDCQTAESPSTVAQTPVSSPKGTGSCPECQAAETPSTEAQTPLSSSMGAGGQPSFAVPPELPPPVKERQQAPAAARAGDGAKQCFSAAKQDWESFNAEKLKWDALNLQPAELPRGWRSNTR